MTATANTSTSSRSATVTVTGGGITRTVSVTQDEPTPTLDVSPTSYNFVASGGTSSTITVTSNQSWTVSDNASWLTTSKTSGSNSSTFTMTATANASTSSRSATVTVEGGGITRTVSVTQNGATPVELTVSPISYNFPASGGTSSTITVTSNQSWTVSDNASWLTTSKTSGSNSSTFTMTATANTSTSPRSATVTITGGGITKTVSVTQDGATPAATLDVSSESYNFVASGGTSSAITVTSNQSWTVSDNASWLTTSKTSGSNNSTFTMTATENTSTSSRSATVTVTGGGISRTVSVTQDRPTPCNGVEPLLTTQWNQYAPYYDNCPMVDGYRTLTGYVATAMAQIMNYHKHPTQRTVKLPAYPTSTLHIAIPAITGTTTYGWNSMNNTTTNAVAKLMYECGVSVKMDYDYSDGINNDIHNGSGASVGNDVGPVSALPEYFNYNSRIDAIVKDDYNGDWDSKLREELDAGRPIFYCGFGSGGHAFVCDGYTCDDGKFHFNWGWGGSGDGYFATSALDPNNHNYSDDQIAVINIKPNPAGYTYATGADGTNTFAVTANAGTGGYIIPAGNSYVYSGENKPYSFTANTGYEIDQVWIDGILNASAKANGYHIFSSVTANHSIIVTFKASSTGIEVLHSQDISVYPNPTKDEIFIKSELQIKKIEIYSLTGSLLFSENNFNEKISMRNFAAGVYLVKIYTDKGSVVSKVVKK
jgi:hypothetical protein